MAALSIQVPYPVFYDRDGQPIDNGNIYIGDANLDPITNPLQVYYDEALTITASQPLVTSSGYVYRNGTPTQLYVDATDFSITVNDSKNLLVYNFPTATGIGVNAASIEYDPPFTGAVTSGYTISDKLEQTVSAKDFGAVGDGTTDDTAALNDFLAAVGSGLAGFIPDGTYCFTAPLDPVIANNITLYGPGYLLYTGTAAPADNLLTFGDGVSLYQFLNLRFGGIGSSTALTANFAIRVRKFVGVNINTNINGFVGSQGNLYQGIWFDNTSTINLGTTQFYTTNRNILWNDGSELHCASAQVYGQFIAGNGTGIGIHIAGGCGGFYSENINQLYNEYGVIIDNDVSAAGNTQMFFDTGTFDTNKIAAVFVNDSVSNSLSKNIHFGCWASSSTAGSGLVVSNWRDGKVYITTAKLINHSGAAIYLDDATVRVELSNASRISNNDVGIDAGVAITVLGNPTPFDNATADFGALVSVENTLYGLQKIVQDPAEDWMISSIPNSIILASGANVKLADGTGLLMVTNTFNGDNGLYLVGGSGVSFISSNAGTFVAPSTTPAAGKVSVAWNGSTGYNIYSNFGSSQTYIVSLLLKTRDAV